MTVSPHPSLLLSTARLRQLISATRVLYYTLTDEEILIAQSAYSLIMSAQATLAEMETDRMTEVSDLLAKFLVWASHRRFAATC